MKYILVNSFEVDTDDSSKYVFVFNDTMKNETLTDTDMQVTIESTNKITYTWSASYSDSKTLIVKVEVKSVLEGTEKLQIKLSNHKKFKSEEGG